MINKLIEILKLPKEEDLCVRKLEANKEIESEEPDIYKKEESKYCYYNCNGLDRNCEGYQSGNMIKK